MINTLWKHKYQPENSICNKNMKFIFSKGVFLSNIKKIINDIKILTKAEIIMYMLDIVWSNQSFGFLKWNKNILFSFARRINQFNFWFSFHTYRPFSIKLFYPTKNSVCGETHCFFYSNLWYLQPIFFYLQHFQHFGHNLFLDYPTSKLISKFRITWT